MTGTTGQDADAVAAAKVRHGELPAERRRLEERAEAEIVALAGTLDEISALDADQREAEIEGWIRPPVAPEYDQRRRLVLVTHDWIGDRLGGHVHGARLLARSAEGHERTLADRDPLTPTEES